VSIGFSGRVKVKVELCDPALYPDLSPMKFNKLLAKTLTKSISFFLCAHSRPHLPKLFEDVRLILRAMPMPVSVTEISTLPSPAWL